MDSGDSIVDLAKYMRPHIYTIVNGMYTKLLPTRRVVKALCDIPRPEHAEVECVRIGKLIITPHILKSAHGAKGQVIITGKQYYTIMGDGSMYLSTVKSGIWGTMYLSDAEPGDYTVDILRAIRKADPAGFAQYLYLRPRPIASQRTYKPRKGPPLAVSEAALLRMAGRVRESEELNVETISPRVRKWFADIGDDPAYIPLGCLQLTDLPELAVVCNELGITLH